MKKIYKFLLLIMLLLQFGCLLLLLKEPKHSPQSIVQPKAWPELAGNV